MSIRKSDNGNACPIIFVEQPIMHDLYIDEVVTEKNYILSKKVKECQQLGFKDIYLIDQEGSLGLDQEATVDGVHYNDIGFQRFAKHMLNSIEKFL